MKRLLWVAVVAACETGQQLPPEKPAPTPAPIQPPRCERTNQMAPLAPAFGAFAGYTDDEAFQAAAQFLVSSGTNILEKDDRAHTLITVPFTGQTILSTCGVNEYRVYKARVVVTGTQMVVTMDCKHSYGREGYYYGYTYIPADRGTLVQCDYPTFITVGDATLSKNIIEGARSMLGLRAP